MSGEWIKMRVSLVSHPKVMRAAESLLSDSRYIEWSGLSYGVRGYPPPTQDEDQQERHVALRVTRYVTVTALLRFWGYANEHAKRETVECLTRNDVDDIVALPGFADALAAVGWLRFRDGGGVDLPGFSEHNTTANDRKTGGAERQKRYRDRKKAEASLGGDSDVTHDVTSDVTSREREEKRREEEKTIARSALAGKPADPEGFAEFWDSWPKTDRKQDRKKCAEKWARCGYSKAKDDILAHVEALKHTKKWVDGFEPAPLTYLNGERWRDGPAVDGMNGTAGFL